MALFNTGLVAVPNRAAGGFHVYMTGGMWEPSKWVRGTLDGAAYHEDLASLRAAAESDGRALVRYRDYYQLAPMARAAEA